MYSRIVRLVCSSWKTDAVYLYGSRASGTHRPDSDWDIAVLFRDFIHDPVERHSRPQQVEAVLQRKLKLYDRISVVDIEIVPPPLQMNIIRGKRIYDRGVPHVRQVEQAVVSRIEKDYDGWVSGI